LHLLQAPQQALSWNVRDSSDSGPVKPDAGDAPVMRRPLFVTPAIFTSTHTTAPTPILLADCSEINLIMTIFSFPLARVNSQQAAKRELHAKARWSSLCALHYLIRSSG
jgi:hypothetical protein